MNLRQFFGVCVTVLTCILCKNVENELRVYLSQRVAF